MPQVETRTEFYRPETRQCPNFAPRCPRSDERAALREIHLLIASGLPVSLCEARKRLSAINLIATEGLGRETIFEMVCRILAAEPVNR